MDRMAGAPDPLDQRAVIAVADIAQLAIQTVIGAQVNDGPEGSKAVILVARDISEKPSEML